MGGRPMPTVLSSLGAQGVHIRRSEVTMVAGQPGAGKSLVALWHAVGWAEQHGLRGIYFSADSAELGQAARALAMVMMNLTAVEAEALLEKDDPWAVEGLTRLNNLFWSFEDDLSYDNINDEIEAFIELWGVAPDFVIVDNLTDVEGQAEDEGGMQRRAMKALVQLARKTDSAVIVLHHTSEDPRYKENPCPPRSAIMFKVTAKPSLVITTADYGPRRPLAVVKNRYGQSDKSGCTATWFWLDQETLHWRDA
jgi:KaiC/GvpD/RAD55 family RecA-like ATPase